MDITQYLELKIAPRGIFDRLSERKTRVRFMRRPPSGFEFGVHALLAVASMRLKSSEANRLAAAVRADLFGDFAKVG